MKQTPKPNPSFDPVGFGALTSEDYYVFSRVDGASSLHDLILSTGLGAEKTIAILTKLRDAGAFVLPGDAEQRSAPARQTAVPARSAPVAAAPRARATTPEPVPSSAASEFNPNSTPNRTNPRPPLRPLKPKAEPAAPDRPADDSDSDVIPIELAPAEEAALAEPVDLSERERRRVITYLRKVQAGDYFSLLGVAVDVDKKTLKRAYFRLSKEFHPDRYYGKKTGSFGPWLAQIFETASKAFDALADETARARHIALLRGEPTPQQAVKSQSPAEHARQLFDTACSSEARGELDEALKYFGAAVRVDPHARYLRRAAEAAVRAKRFDIAEDYAKRAVSLKDEDPSYARVLAKVYYAAGNFEAAEDTLVGALLLKTENDRLSAELEQDLDKVRRALVGV